MPTLLKLLEPANSSLFSAAKIKKKYRIETENIIDNQ